jgi:adenylate cyclase
VKGKVSASFEDQGEQKLKNIAEPVRAYRVTLAGDATSMPGAAVGAIDLSLPDKPSIAVLPFANMSGDPEQEYFTDGITEDIIPELSRFQALFVIARNSSFTYKGKAVDVKRISKELGVRYVVEGSIRRAGDRVRVTAQLIDSFTGNHLWAEKYDRVLEDIFAVQEEVTECIVAAIAPQVDAAESLRARRAFHRRGFPSRA